MICCYFQGDGDCDGQLIRAHLLPRQVLRREFPYGVVCEDDRWRRLSRYEDRYDLAHRSVNDLIEDPRSWVPCCGGPTGIGGHHGRLDGKQMRVTDLPIGFIEYCAELDLGWYVARYYA